ncbi:hypothetical protein OFM52_32020, partial [Escherichia coli]|nr:hypothetical protein [Escherichia coli]
MGKRTKVEACSSSPTWETLRDVNNGLKLPKKIVLDSPQTADSVPQNHHPSFPRHMFGLRGHLLLQRMG